MNTLNYSSPRQKRFLEEIGRLKLEFPVAEISKRTGYTDGTVSPYLKPEAKASSRFIQSVADAFGFDASPILNAEVRKSIKIVYPNDSLINERPHLAVDATQTNEYKGDAINTGELNVLISQLIAQREDVKAAVEAATKAANAATALAEKMVIVYDIQEKVQRLESAVALLTGEAPSPSILVPGTRKRHLPKQDPQIKTGGKPVDK